MRSSSAVFSQKAPYRFGLLSTKVYIQYIYINFDKMCYFWIKNTPETLYLIHSYHTLYCISYTLSISNQVENKKRKNFKLGCHLSQICSIICGLPKKMKKMKKMRIKLSPVSHLLYNFFKKRKWEKNFHLSQICSIIF